VHRDVSRRSRKRARRLSWLEWLWLGSIYGAVILGMCFLGATARPYQLDENAYNGPTLIYSSDHKLLAKLYEEYRKPVQLKQIPLTTIHAILAAEDVRFYRHHGLDARGMARALWYDLRAGHLDQGGSTITQQLVRYSVLNDEHSIRRKIHEAVLAIRVERAYTKDQILERYLNAVYFGDGAYGIGAAAEYYFGKSVEALTPAEGALLAGLIRDPGAGNPRGDLTIALRRQQGVLRTMRHHQWLTSTQYAHALQEKIVLRPHQRSAWQAPYVVEWVREYLVRRYGRATVYRGGMTVYTTIDSKMQRAAERALAHAVAAGHGQRVGNGALVAIEPKTGNIRALVGGVNFWHSPYDRAIQAHRQPGSAFKVFVYQAAFDAGHTLYDYAMDAPITVATWSPKNYRQAYHGAVTLKQALAYSLNSVAVRLTLEVGTHAVIAAARQAGIISTLTPNLSLALGASEVTPVEMARAFATYANGGRSIDPSLISEIDYRGQQLWRTTPLAHQMVKPATAFFITEGLQYVISNGTGQRASIGRPAAGKTGTSNDFRDAWFVGYTPDLSTAVWLGNDDRSPMLGVAGGSYPAQAWAEFMRAALQGKPPHTFSEPGTLFANRPITPTPENVTAMAPTSPPAARNRNSKNKVETAPPPAPRAPRPATTQPSVSPPPPDAGDRLPPPGQPAAPAPPGVTLPSQPLPDDGDHLPAPGEDDPGDDQASGTD
jgi:penicillin-binding protein 1A